MTEITQNKIGQLTAKRDYAAKMLEHGRATQHDLAQAQADLDSFLATIQMQTPFISAVISHEVQKSAGNQKQDRLMSEAELPIHIQALNTDFKTIQHQLLMSHRELRTKQAMLGNMLALIPKEQNTIDICQELISLQKKIEAIWDQYRFIQHNGRLPDMALDIPREELSEPEKAKLNETKLALHRLYDKRGKLKAKIKNPTIHAKSYKAMQDKPAEWASELAFCEKEIASLELIRNALEI